MICTDTTVSGYCQYPLTLTRYGLPETTCKAPAMLFSQAGTNTTEGTMADNVTFQWQGKTLTGQIISRYVTVGGKNRVTVADESGHVYTLRETDVVPA